MSLTEGDNEPDYDVNADGTVNMFDYIAIKSVYFNIGDIDSNVAARSDINGDGKVNIFDYLTVKTYILK